MKFSLFTTLALVAGTFASPVAVQQHETTVVKRQLEQPATVISELFATVKEQTAAISKTNLRYPEPKPDSLMLT
jgi:hypothetical protein